MAFTKVAAAGISSSGSFTLENSTITGVLTATSATIGVGITLSGTQINVGSATTLQSTGILLRNVSASGIVTASGGFVGNVTGNATGLSGTPNITVGAITASSAVISGNVSVAGTVYYEDVINVDSIGVVTARSGIVVAAGTTAAPSISPTGDSNTGIFFPAPDTVAIGEGGVEALRVDSSGNLGIGTINTGNNKVEIVGTSGGIGLGINNNVAIAFKDFSGTSRRTSLLSSTGNFYFGDIDNGLTGSNLFLLARNSVSLFTNSVARVTVGAAGSVGISTNNPSAPLEVGLNQATGNIFRTTSGNFNQDFQRTILDVRGVGGGSTGGYLLIIPAYPGTGNVSGKKFYGTIIADRGSEGSGNSTNVAYVHASTAFNNDVFLVQVDRNNQYFSAASKVTYNGIAYLALKFDSQGGDPIFGIYVNGYHRGVDSDSNFLKLVIDSEVSNVTTIYGTRTVRF